MVRVLLIITAAISLMIGMVVFRLSRMREVPEADDPQHIRLSIPQGYDYGRSNFGRQLDISPDGKQVVYVGKQNTESRRLLLHRIGEPAPSEIPGTEGANDPSFSPDGKYIAFYADGRVKKASLEAKTVTVIGVAQPPRGIAWFDSDTFILGNVSGTLLRLTASEETPTALFPMFVSQPAHLSPYVLPNKKAILCTIANGPLTKARIAVIDLNTGDEKQLLDENAFAPRYTSSGQLIFAQGFERRLKAVRFDENKLEVVGAPVPVLNVALAGIGSGGSTDYGFSTAGSLVYALRFNDSLDEALANLTNSTLREIHIQQNWLDEVKRLVP